MNLRKDTAINPDFGIFFPLEEFPTPPCQPSKGKAVLERVEAILNSHPKNRKDVDKATYQAGIELMEQWTRGDGCIPLLDARTVKGKISAFRENFRWVGAKSRQSKPAYQARVRIILKCLLQVKKISKKAY